MCLYLHDYIFIYIYVLIYIIIYIYSIAPGIPPGREEGRGNEEGRREGRGNRIDKRGKREGGTGIFSQLGGSPMGKHFVVILIHLGPKLNQIGHKKM